MHNKKIAILLFVFVLSLPTFFTINVKSETSELPIWDSNWTYRQEIILPISTEDPYSIYQPIDIHIDFENSCWAKNATHHSVRVLCWDGNKWNELESQIYNLKFSTSSEITKCGLVFLIPPYANGEERYFIYYDDGKKLSPNYEDHVKIEDAYYYFEPISGISAEGDYYKLMEDGYCVYGIGQKGNVIYRELSQCVVKQKPGSKDFSVINSDNLASFCFSYHKGVEDEDEISSDQILIAKEIRIDGNLMIEFRIVSQSNNKILKTSNTYRYYYSPTEDKRISANVRHEVIEDFTVEGILNVDGRFGAIITFSSKSERIEKMRFGEIYPYLHLYGENDRIREYSLNIDPEGKTREWIIPYSDDADLGSKAWFSYGEGETGKAQAIIFSSNTDIIKNGVDEKDGIQIKVAEKEYMNALGAEIDYAALNFGRNSYEKGETHDIDVPAGLIVEYDAEFFTTEKGGYEEVIKEAEFYQTLVKHRDKEFDESSNGDPYIHTLTVVPKGTARLFFHPLLSNITKINITSIFAEIYQNDKILAKTHAVKPLLGPPLVKFPKLAEGEYIVKVYRQIGKYIVNYIGVRPVYVDSDKRINIFCTWPKEYWIEVYNQNDELIPDVEIRIIKNESIIERNFTDADSQQIIKLPFSLTQDYKISGYYQGFEVFNDTAPIIGKKIKFNFKLHEVIIRITDKIGFIPGVDVNPYLISKEMKEQTEIHPRDLGFGRFQFQNLPEAQYELHLSYGSFSDIIAFNIPYNNDILAIDFGAVHSLKTDLLDSRGNSIDIQTPIINIYRNDLLIKECLKVNEQVSLPPGKYQLKAYDEGNLIGIKNINLNSDRSINIVTNIRWMTPFYVFIISLIIIAIIVFLLLLKKISLNTFFKLLAMFLIIVSIFLPWWNLEATSKEISAMRNTEMFVYPQTMIEKTQLNDQTYFDLATIPELFTDFVGILLLIVISGFLLMGFSFIPNIFLRKRFSLVLIFASALFLILVAVAFSYGMSKITELSIGGLIGSGTMNVNLPTDETIQMNGSWGLGFGFYLCIIAALIVLFGGIIDFLRSKKWPKILY